VQRIGAARIAPFGETVFATYSRLARVHNAINLGQGFPDFDPPDVALDALAASVAGDQQYAPLPGLPALLDEAALELGPRLGRELDPASELLITVGATEALYAAVQALVDPDDEVVLFEPFYDAYPAHVLMAGGRPRYVPLLLEGGRWRLDPVALARSVTDRTRLIIINTPHNPTGMRFTAEDLDAVVAAAERHDALILADEVYEHISFAPHVPVASRPGAWERTISVHSFGKSFSVTGWKIGWAAGPEEAISALRTAHQWIPYVVATPLQAAAADTLQRVRTEGGSYYRTLATDMARRRDLLLEALAPTPFIPIVPDGGYFVLADSSALGYPDDHTLCRALPERAGVVAIPPSAFYSADHRHLARHLVRFAYCKRDAALIEAGERLAAADLTL
jgi:aspartate/methionine/tyrosine aminotransferase